MATGIRLTRNDQSCIVAAFMDGKSPACAAMDYAKVHYPNQAAKMHYVEWNRLACRCLRAVIRRLQKQVDEHVVDEHADFNEGFHHHGSGLF